MKREGSPKPPQRRFILALHYTPDGKQLAFSEFDGAIRFHDSDSGKALHVA